MKSKKIMALLMALVMVVSMAACGKKDEKVQTFPFSKEFDCGVSISGTAVVDGLDVTAEAVDVATADQALLDAVKAVSEKYFVYKVEASKDGEKAAVATAKISFKIGDLNPEKAGVFEVLYAADGTISMKQLKSAVNTDTGMVEVEVSDNTLGDFVVCETDSKVIESTDTNDATTGDEKKDENKGKGTSTHAGSSTSSGKPSSGSGNSGSGSASKPTGSNSGSSSSGSGTASKPSGGGSSSAGGSSGSSSGSSSSSGSASNPSGGSGSGGSSSSGGSGSSGGSSGSSSSSGSASNPSGGSGSGGSSSSGGSGSSGGSSGSSTEQPKPDKWVYDKECTRSLMRWFDVGETDRSYWSAAEATFGTDTAYYCSEDAVKTFNAVSKQYINGEVSADHVKSVLTNTIFIPAAMGDTFKYTQSAVSNFIVGPCASDEEAMKQAIQQANTCSYAYGYVEVYKNESTGAHHVYIILAGAAEWA